MKLFYTDASPFARKCRLVIREKGAAGVEEIAANPFENGTDLLKANPAGQVPALIPAEGPTLVGSALICAYLDERLDGPPMIPQDSDARFAALGRQSLGDAALDAAVRLTQENRRPAETRSDYWKDRWTSALNRTLDVCETMAPPADEVDLGWLTIASLLEYIDFRHEDFDWRAGRPALGGWLEVFGARPFMAATRPSA
ncbi:MAG: glutathione S-transferase N-terminal domain-containing protein [Pseudomonadota bacterium]